MSQYYYSRDGKWCGPVSAAQLRQLAASRVIQEEDFIAKDGIADPTPARNVKGLFAAVTPPLPQQGSEEVLPAELISTITEASHHNNPCKSPVQRGLKGLWSKVVDGVEQATTSLGVAQTKKREELTQTSAEAARIAQMVDATSVSTIGIPGPFQVLGVVFACAVADRAVAAYEEASRKLKEQALRLGGNAVIGARFDYRVALGDTGFLEHVFLGNSTKQVFEVFAYGTAVQTG